MKTNNCTLNISCIKNMAIGDIIYFKNIPTLQNFVNLTIDTHSDDSLLFVPYVHRINEHFLNVYLDANLEVITMKLSEFIFEEERCVTLFSDNKHDIIINYISFAEQFIDQITYFANKAQEDIKIMKQLEEVKDSISQFPEKWI